MYSLNNNIYYEKLKPIEQSRVCVREKKRIKTMYINMKINLYNKVTQLNTELLFSFVQFDSVVQYKIKFNIKKNVFSMRAYIIKAKEKKKNIW